MTRIGYCYHCGQEINRRSEACTLNGRLLHTWCREDYKITDLTGSNSDALRGKI